MTAKVRFGLSNVHIAKRTVGSGGVVSYATPVAVAGAVSFVCDKEVAKSVFYADNIKYKVNKKLAGFSGTLEMALIPDTIKTDYLGFKADTNGKLVLTDENGADCAIMWQEDTDDGVKKYAMFNCSLSPYSQGSKTTEDNADPQTRQIDVDCIGETVGTRQCFVTEVADFTSLSLPTFASI